MPTQPYIDFLKVKNPGPSTVAYAYNPSCCGDGDREDCGLRPGHTKFARPHLNNKLGIVVHALNPSYAGGINRRTAVQASLGKNGLWVWSRWYNA
jgi:hypothetical protein